MDGFFGKNVRKLVEQIVKVATQCIFVKQVGSDASVDHVKATTVDSLYISSIFMIF